MEATEILMAEHRVIERVLDALEQAATRLANGGPVPADFFLKAAEFIKGFADGCHHRKEEDVLFAELVAGGFSRESGPVAVMLGQHEEGRRLTRAMRETALRMRDGDVAAGGQVARFALSFVALLRDHISKEDSILFPLVDRTFSPERQTAVAAAFEHIEHEETGAGVHEKYLALASELEQVMASRRAPA
jgi:hemerythrin-like domain-containing protein